MSMDGQPWSHRGAKRQEVDAIMSMDGRYFARRQEVDAIMSMDGRYFARRQEVDAIRSRCDYLLISAPYCESGGIGRRAGFRYQCL